MSKILDSGERTEFSTGAVRDMHAGKGRFDLLPWHAVHDVAKHCEEGAQKYGERNVDKGIPQHSLIDSAIRHLVRYMHNEKDEPHLRAAAWNVLWALEQETTHPEMLDLPGQVAHSDFKPEYGADVCPYCKYEDKEINEDPCYDCKYGFGNDDNFEAVDNRAIIEAILKGKISKPQ